MNNSEKSLKISDVDRDWAINRSTLAQGRLAIFNIIASHNALVDKVEDLEAYKESNQRLAEQCTNYAEKLSDECAAHECTREEHRNCTAYVGWHEALSAKEQAERERDAALARVKELEELLGTGLEARCVAAESALALARALIDGAVTALEAWANPPDEADAFERTECDLTAAVEAQQAWLSSHPAPAPTTPPPAPEPVLRPEFIALRKALTEPVLCFEGDCAKMTGRARPCPIHDDPTLPRSSARGVQ